MKDEQIRVSIKFKESIDYIRAKCLLNYGYCPSSADITDKIIQRINKDEIWQIEFNKK
jgi:hypothetical protein